MNGQNQKLKEHEKYNPEIMFIDRFFLDLSSDKTVSFQAFDLLCALSCKHNYKVDEVCELAFNFPFENNILENLLIRINDFDFLADILKQKFIDVFNGIPVVYKGVLKNQNIRVFSSTNPLIYNRMLKFSFFLKKENKNNDSGLTIEAEPKTGLLQEINKDLDERINEIVKKIIPDIITDSFSKISQKDVDKTVFLLVKRYGSSFSSEPEDSYILTKIEDILATKRMTLKSFRYILSLQQKTMGKEERHSLLKACMKHLKIFSRLSDESNAYMNDFELSVLLNPGLPDKEKKNLKKLLKNRLSKNDGFKKAENEVFHKTYLLTKEVYDFTYELIKDSKVDKDKDFWSRQKLMSFIGLIGFYRQLTDECFLRIHPILNEGRIRKKHSIMISDLKKIYNLLVKNSFEISKNLKSNPTMIADYLCRVLVNPLLDFKEHSVPYFSWNSTKILETIALYGSCEIVLNMLTDLQNLKEARRTLLYLFCKQFNVNISSNESLVDSMLKSILEKRLVSGVRDIESLKLSMSLTPETKTRKISSLINKTVDSLKSGDLYEICIFLDFVLKQNQEIIPVKTLKEFLSLFFEKSKGNDIFNSNIQTDFFLFTMLSAYSKLKKKKMDKKTRVNMIKKGCFKTDVLDSPLSNLSFRKLCLDFLKDNGLDLLTDMVKSKPAEVVEFGTNLLSMDLFKDQRSVLNIKKHIMFTLSNINISMPETSMFQFYPFNITDFIQICKTRTELYKKMSNESFQKPGEKQVVDFFRSMSHELFNPILDNPLNKAETFLVSMMKDLFNKCSIETQSKLWTAMIEAGTQRVRIMEKSSVLVKTMLNGMADFLTKNFDWLENNKDFLSVEWIDTITDYLPGNRVETFLLDLINKDYIGDLSSKIFTGIDSMDYEKKQFFDSIELKKECINRIQNTGVKKIREKFYSLKDDKNPGSFEKNVFYTLFLYNVKKLKDREFLLSKAFKDKEKGITSFVLDPNVSEENIDKNFLLACILLFYKKKPFSSSYFTENIEFTRKLVQGLKYHLNEYGNFKDVRYLHSRFTKTCIASLKNMEPSESNKVPENLRFLIESYFQALTKAHLDESRQKNLNDFPGWAETMDTEIF